MFQALRGLIGCAALHTEHDVAGAHILHGLDDLTRRTLLDQIRFWSRNLQGGAEQRASERLLASVK